MGRRFTYLEQDEKHSVFDWTAGFKVGNSAPAPHMQTGTECSINFHVEKKNPYCISMYIYFFFLFLICLHAHSIIHFWHWFLLRHKLNFMIPISIQAPLARIFSVCVWGASMNLFAIKISRICPSLDNNFLGGGWGIVV